MSYIQRISALSALLLVACLGCSPPPAGDNTDSNQQRDTGAEDANNGADRDAGSDADTGVEDTDTNTGGDDETGRIETHFNRPEPGERDHTLEDLVIDLLEDTPDDATVRAAYYTFSRTGAAEAFADAHDRGVDLQLIVDNDTRHDDGTDWQAVELLRDRLGEDFTICQDDEDTGGCHGTRIQHNKFILFSETGDGAEDVVLQSSANLTNPQLEQFNNTVLIEEDTALYETYLDYWQDLSADETDLDYYRTAEGDLDTKVHFFPREDGDTIIEILEDVDCEDGTEVHVGMAYFTDPRVGVATHLTRLADEGCEVRVLVRQGLDRVGILVMAEMDNSDVKLSAFPPADDDEDSVSIHSKYMLLDGTFRGETDQQIVWTGSHNYTGPALDQNDETLLRIRDDETHEAFVDDWNNAEGFAEPVNH